jgi:molybdenum cofactor guanylyltransferase
MASAAILVGGQARRFEGRDKSALLVGGQSILDRQLEQLAEVTDDILLVGRTTAAETARPHTRAVADRSVNCGPLGGLDAALASARDDVLVLLACDMPFVTAALMTYLIAAAHAVDVVVPRTERGYHPLCAVYTRACRPVVARRLAERRLAMTALFEDVRIRVVEGSEIAQFGDPARVLANVNTPAEFGELEALLGHKP